MSNQREILHALHNHGPMTNKELARLLNTTTSDNTQPLLRMFEAGFLEREEVSNDKPGQNPYQYWISEAEAVTYSNEK